MFPNEDSISNSSKEKWELYIYSMVLIKVPRQLILYTLQNSLLSLPRKTLKKLGTSTLILKWKDATSILKGTKFVLFMMPITKGEIMMATAINEETIELLEDEVPEATLDKATDDGIKVDGKDDEEGK